MNVYVWKYQATEAPKVRCAPLCATFAFGLGPQKTGLFIN